MELDSRWDEMPDEMRWWKCMVGSGVKNTLRGGGAAQQ